MSEYLQVLFEGTQEENDYLIKKLKEQFENRIVEIEYKKRGR